MDMIRIIFTSILVIIGLAAIISLLDLAITIIKFAYLDIKVSVQKYITKINNCRKIKAELKNRERKQKEFINLINKKIAEQEKWN